MPVGPYETDDEDYPVAREGSSTSTTSASHEPPAGPEALEPGDAGYAANGDPG